MNKTSDKCINPECDRIAHGRRLRCWRCRKTYNYRCVGCGTEVDTAQSVRCRECHIKYKKIYCVGYHKKYYKPKIRKTTCAETILDMIKQLKTVQEITNELGISSVRLRSFIYHLRKKQNHNIIFQSSYILKPSQ